MRKLAERLRIAAEDWFYDESRPVALEACEGQWRPAVRALAAGPLDVPSVAASVAAFNAHIRPMERAAGTRGKYKTHRLSVLTWAVGKGLVKGLLPMSEDLVRALAWAALAFDTVPPVLRNSPGAVGGGIAADNALGRGGSQLGGLLG